MAEEIIIDGVNVYKCGNAKRSIFGIDMECRLGCDCSQRPNCYFKQLKRKEQECQQLKAALQASDFAKAVISSAEIKFPIIEKLSTVLDEIENYVRDNSDFDKSDKLTSNTGAYDILEIINKAKDSHHYDL